MVLIFVFGFPQVIVPFDVLWYFFPVLLFWKKRSAVVLLFSVCSVYFIFFPGFWFFTSDSAATSNSSGPSERFVPREVPIVDGDADAFKRKGSRSRFPDWYEPNGDLNHASPRLISVDRGLRSHLFFFDLWVPVCSFGELDHSPGNLNALTKN